MAPGMDRPRNADRTRAQILHAARVEFSRSGFAATTVRAVATSAGVSPNLIARYFGGKEGLFVAATEVHLSLDSVFAGDRASFGVRLAESIVGRWTAMPGQDPLLTLHRASGEKPEAAVALTAFLDRESFEPVRSQLLRYGLSPDEAESRARAVDVFVLGISTRYRVLSDELGDIDQLRSWIADTVQRLVDGP